MCHQVALLNFSLSLSADRVDQVPSILTSKPQTSYTHQADNIMGVCTEVIRDGVTRNEQSTLSDSGAIKVPPAAPLTRRALVPAPIPPLPQAVVDLLQIPLNAWSNALSILELAHYPRCPTPP